MDNFMGKAKQTNSVVELEEAETGKQTMKLSIKLSP